jgi:hypothetical protein
MATKLVWMHNDTKCILQNMRIVLQKPSNRKKKKKKKKKLKRCCNVVAPFVVLRKQSLRNQNNNACHRHCYCCSIYKKNAKKEKEIGHCYNKK